LEKKARGASLALKNQNSWGQDFSMNFQHIFDPKVQKNSFFRTEVLQSALKLCALVFAAWITSCRVFPTLVMSKAGKMTLKKYSAFLNFVFCKDIESEFPQNF